MTKATIVTRLLKEGYIITEEAVVLLENTIILQEISPTGSTLPTNSDMVPYNEICPCNPKNGGSGVCGCTIGNKMVNKGGLHSNIPGYKTSTNVEE